jgi:hypothetical protein
MGYGPAKAEDEPLLIPAPWSGSSFPLQVVTIGHRSPLLRHASSYNNGRICAIAGTSVDDASKLTGANSQKGEIKHEEE